MQRQPQTRKPARARAGLSSARASRTPMQTPGPARYGPGPCRPGTTTSVAGARRWRRYSSTTWCLRPTPPICSTAHGGTRPGIHHCNRERPPVGILTIFGMMDSDGLHRDLGTGSVSAVNLLTGWEQGAVPVQRVLDWGFKAPVVGCSDCTGPCALHACLLHNLLAIVDRERVGWGGWISDCCLKRAAWPGGIAS